MTTTAIDPTLELWRMYVEQRCGMSFSATRMRVLSQCLEARVKSGGYRSLAEYYQAATQPSGATEFDLLFQLLLNNETRFFRDGPGFAALKSVVFPEFRQTRWTAGRTKLNFWSAGCSTGQEAYSLAMICLETDAQRAWDIQVLGTDVHPDNLARCNRGQYRSFEVKSLEGKLRDRYFVGTDAEGYAVNELLRSIVRFELLNLASPVYAIPQQDVIFCQNVLIYYAATMRVNIIRKLTQSLLPGGYLFLGAAEAVGIPTPGLELVQLADAWIYRRVG
jgi:chemotaxis methyl-accepting protein methylase